MKPQDNVHTHQSSQQEPLKPNTSPQYSQSIKKLKPHSTIRYKLNNDSNWIEAEIINCAGKATGKYSNCWNISNNDGQRLSIDLSKIKQWEITKEPDTKSKNEDEWSNCLSSSSLNEISDDETQTHETLITTNKSQQLEAKMIELMAKWASIWRNRWLGSTMHFPQMGNERKSCQRKENH